MKLIILVICVTSLFLLDNTESFGILPDALKSEVSGSIQAIIDRDLGPMDIVGR